MTQRPRAPRADQLDALALAAREAERRIVLAYLEANGGNLTHTAKALGIELRTLHNKINMHELRDYAAVLRGKKGQ